MNDDKKTEPAARPLNEELQNDELQDTGGGKAGRSSPTAEKDEVLNKEATKAANADEDLRKI